MPYKDPKKHREANCESQRRYRQTEKGRETMRRWRQSEKGREATRRYQQSEQGRQLARARKDRWRQTEKGREAQRQATRRYRQTEKGRAATLRYRKSEQGRQLKQEARQRWRQTEKGREAQRRNRWTRQGIQLEQGAWLLVEQGGVCAIQGELLTLETAQIDHDHSCCPGSSCGRCIRGLVCRACNGRLGWEENGRLATPEIMAYLRRGYVVFPDLSRDAVAV